jgi:hypothetical protein
LKVQNYFLLGPTVSALNAELVARVRSNPPDVLLLYRPTHIFAATVRAVQKQAPSMLVVSYNNDDPFSLMAPPHLWRHYRESLPAEDVALAYREKNLSELTAAGAPRVGLLRSYYLPYIHKAADLTEKDRLQFQADVSFVGHFEPDGRLPFLVAAAESFPGFRLFGPEWDRAPSHPALRRLLPTQPLSHPDYVKAIQCSKIALVFFSGLNNDRYTRRVFEIPAIGTFMLSQRTAEMEALFAPGIEADYFSSPAELVDKVRYYLDHDEERGRIAAAGAERVRRDGHDVFSRMRELTVQLREWLAAKRRGSEVSP